MKGNALVHSTPYFTRKTKKEHRGRQEFQDSNAKFRMTGPKPPLIPVGVRRCRSVRFLLALRLLRSFPIPQRRENSASQLGSSSFTPPPFHSHAPPIPQHRENAQWIGTAWVRHCVLWISTCPANRGRGSSNHRGIVNPRTLRGSRTAPAGHVRSPRLWSAWR